MAQIVSRRFSVALLVLAGLAFCGGVLCACCSSAEAHPLPSALDARAIDITGAGTPASIPSISSGVPKGSILRVDHWTAVTGVREFQSQGWVDFVNHRARLDWYPQSVPTSSGGPASTASDQPAGGIQYSVVVDGDSSLTYNGNSGRVMAGPADEASLFGGSELDWSGGTSILWGQQLLDGKKVDVYRIDLHIPAGQERSADFGLIYVDSSTGLRLRDEWLLGSPGSASVAHLYDYRLSERTDAVEERMTTAALEGEQTGILAERLGSLKDLDFPIWGFPEQAYGLMLSGVTISSSAKGDSVLLYYRVGGSVGQTVFSIETTDVRRRNDFPPDLLVPSGQAVTKVGDEVLDFGMGSDGQGRTETGVRLQRWPDAGASPGWPSLAELAESLVDVRPR